MTYFSRLIIIEDRFAISSPRLEIAAEPSNHDAETSSGSAASKPRLDKTTIGGSQ